MINIAAIAYVLICIGSGIDLPAPEISEPVIIEESHIELSEEDMDLLYRIVYAEAGGDGIESQKRRNNSYFKPFVCSEVWKQHTGDNICGKSICYTFRNIYG